MDLMRLTTSPIQAHIAEEALLACNDHTATYGLQLSKEAAGRLVAVRTQSLQENGRLELGTPILQKLVLAFYTSPYLYQDIYEETLQELVDLFYTYKNEMLDQLGDDELLTLMREAFDGPCQGSTELLGGKILARTARALRGCDDEDGPAEDEDMDEEDMDA